MGWVCGGGRTALIDYHFDGLGVNGASDEEYVPHRTGEGEQPLCGRFPCAEDRGRSTSGARLLLSGG